MGDHALSEDALGKLLEAIGKVSGDVSTLGKQVTDLQHDSRITNYSLKEIRKEYVALAGAMNDATERLDIAERNLRRHDSGFRQTSETDAKHSSELAAMIIAIEDTRKLSKRALDMIGGLETSMTVASEQTNAQNPVLAKIDGRVKSIALPAKVAAVVNLLVGAAYVAFEVLKLFNHP